MKIYLGIIAFILFAKLPVSAQALQGKVLDAQTGEPLIGASVVTLDGTGTIADETGHFKIETIAAREVLTITFIGYEKLVSDTIIPSGKTVFLEFRLQPITSSLGEVVVSAGRFEQRLEDVTVSLDILKPNLQQDKNLVQLENSLQQAPGVHVNDGTASIRGGSGWSYGTGTRVQTLVDNIPLISGDAGQAQWNLVPIHSMERVEILKGASSVLYGSAAMNGIINVITRPFPEKEALAVNLYSGVYDAPKRESVKWWNKPRTNSGINFDYQKPLGSQTGLVISGGHIYDEGFRYLEEEQRSRLFGKFIYKSTKLKGLEASLAANINYSDAGDALLWESDSLAYVPLDSAITKTYGWDFFIDPKVSFRHGKFLHTVQGRYLQLNNHARSTDVDYTNASDQFFGQYLFQFFYSTKLALTAGFSTTKTKSTSVVFQGEHTSANNALFLQGDYKPLKWINLNGGVRYEDFYLDDRYNRKPVFRGGLNVQFVKGTNARFSYGEAFRFPAISEAFIATGFGTVKVYPNPDLQPETGRSYELGLRQMFYSKFIKGYVDIAAFHMRYYDMIEFTFGGWGRAVPPDLGLGFKPLNVGETLIQGLELSTALEGKFGNTAYRLLAGYTYMLPQVVNPDKPYAMDSNKNQLTYKSTSSDTTNNILKYRYQHLVKVDFQVNPGRWRTGISFRYNDFMQNIDALFVSSVFASQVPGVETNRERNSKGDVIVDIRAGYQFSKHWQVDLLVNNLLNREVMIRPAYMDAPRNFVLRVNYSL